MAETDVPIISLAGFIDGSARDKVVAEVADACRRCGFFMIRDHGVNSAVVDAAWASVRAFFDAPTAVKEDPRLQMAPDYPYGYSGVATEIAGGSYEYGVADKKETLSLCLGPAAGPDPRMPAPRWPSAPADFEPAVTAYYREMEKLAKVLLRVFALALEQPEDFFDALEDKHWSALRCLNYPHSDKPFAPGQMRIAAHTDYGTLTILRADNVPTGGLQVQKLDGAWADVVFPAPDVFTINLGDLMNRWTNGTWKSTLHRVVPPNVDHPGPDGTVPDNRRQSIAFFHNLNRDAMCTVFPSCVTPQRPCLYEPINAFEHLMQRHAAAVGHKAHLSADGTTTTDDGHGTSSAAAEGAKPKVGGGDITGAAWQAAADADKVN